MNISPHLLIDAGILITALTITLVLRAKGNAARKERENKWNDYYLHRNKYFKEGSPKHRKLKRDQEQTQVNKLELA